MALTDLRECWIGAWSFGSQCFGLDAIVFCRPIYSGDDATVIVVFYFPFLLGSGADGNACGRGETNGGYVLQRLTKW